MALTNNKRSSLSSKNFKKVKTSSEPVKAAASYQHQAFWPLVIFTFLVWIVYRTVFDFPVWFDESIGKAIFFGLPVWLYISMTGLRAIPETLAAPKFKSGLMLGIAVGGIIAFVATLLKTVTGGGAVLVQPAPIFAAPEFWGQFLLAMLTAFWETILFFSWIMVVIQEKMKHWSLFKQLVVVAGIFTVFHIPNAIARFELNSLMSFMILMFLFALGQGLLFMYRRNAYALILSHALWGMVLLIHYT